MMYIAVEVWAATSKALKSTRSLKFIIDKYNTDRILYYIRIYCIIIILFIYIKLMQLIHNHQSYKCSSMIKPYSHAYFKLYPKILDHTTHAPAYIAAYKSHVIYHTKVINACMY